MAEPDKIPEPRLDIRTANDPIVENNEQESRISENYSLNESQDFHLVDCGETQKETQEEMESTVSGGEVNESLEISPDSADVCGSQMDLPNRTKLPQESSTTTTPTTTTTTMVISETPEIDVMEEDIEENDTVKIEKEEDAENLKIQIEQEKKFVKGNEDENNDIDDDDDDEDDFVRSSQVEPVSPLKKQLSNLTSMVSQKRKADDNYETLAKFPRTCSQEDALTTVRKKPENEIIDQIFIDEKTKDANDEEIMSNMMIKETPQTQDNEMERHSESPRQIEQDLEEEFSQRPDERNDIKKSDEPDQSNEAATTTTAAATTTTTTTTAAAAITGAAAAITGAAPATITTEAVVATITTIITTASTPTTTTIAAAVAAAATTTIAEKEEPLAMENGGAEKKDATADESSFKIQNDSTIAEISADSTRDTIAEPKEESLKILEQSIEFPIIGASTKERSINDCVQTSNENEENLSTTKIAEFVEPTSTAARSRMSIEVVYDRATAAPTEKKPSRELVEIDEDGEKIVLDSSQESCNDKSLEKQPTDKKTMDTSYKTCASTDYRSIDGSKDSSSSWNDCKSGHSLTNGGVGSVGGTESGIMGSDATEGSARSELLVVTDSSNDKKISEIPSPRKKARPDVSKILDNPEILNVSDSEESFAVIEERSKPKEETWSSFDNDNSTVKVVPMEKELSIVVRLKCLIYVDETTKEQVEKIITGVHCESTTMTAAMTTATTTTAAGDFSTLRNRSTGDNSANLADISGNEKDSSPGSVTSIQHPYPLNPRLSIASTSSSSSAGSLNVKIATGIKFQLPRGPAKHAKKLVIADKRQETGGEDLIMEQIKREWKNVDTLTRTIINFANQELMNGGGIDRHNGSALRVDNSLERIRSSTPEVSDKDVKTVQSAVTPKRGTKRSRISGRAASVKTTRAKNLDSAEVNGLTEDSLMSRVEGCTPPSTPVSVGKKRKSLTVGESMTTGDAIVEAHDVDDETETLVGKRVFAKWSDNRYYPGTVTSKTKTKYRVNFYDGQNKLIIEDFIVPMPAILEPGLSVYATSDRDDYGSCGIILRVKKLVDGGVVYVVETDDSERIEVDVKDIFLTNDQVRVLKDDTKSELKSPPSTPKHLGKITLDNVVDGKRRSKRILTPVATTPKSKRVLGVSDKMSDSSKPSGSGVSASIKFQDNYGSSTSDSNITENDDATNVESIGIQEEIVGTPYELAESKGQRSAVKGGKGRRGKKKFETPEIIANLGPVPAQNSHLFEGMSFVLSCASLDTIERYRGTRESSEDTRDSNSDPGTENEEEWSRKPFVRDRLMAQLIAGGGKVYESFESVPLEEYQNTKHITNVPNTTRKSLLCLSVGIKPYNHQWVIRCCQQNRIVNPSEEELPAGWSLLKKCYVEMFQRRNEKPFQTLPVIVVMPVTPANKEFVSFWRRICENAGGTVLPVENPDDGFIEGTVVLTNKHCPTWVIEKASSWNIPLVSTAWIVECLIEGNICSDDAHPSFKHNYVERSSSRGSHLKRR